jgi:hypothetical protein
MAEPKADMAQAPAPEAGSIVEASEALLNMLDADEAPPTEEETQPLEDEESTPETDDDESEEAEAEESDDDDYEPEENTETEGDDAPEVYNVKVDGVDTEVTLDELKSGYSRHSDYTKKTQAISEERKQMQEMAVAFQQEVQQTQHTRNQYIQQIGNYVQQGLHGLQQYGQINWAQLKDEDPLEYVTKRDEFREEQQRVRDMQSQQQRAMQVQQQEGQKAYSDNLESEQAKLMEAMPEWADEKKRPELAGQIREYAISAGLSAEEIDSVTDHRHVQILLKAAKYDALQNSDLKSKKVKRNPKLVSAGNRKGKGQTNAKKRKSQMNRLSETGSYKDAAKLMEDLL